MFFYKPGVTTGVAIAWSRGRGGEGDAGSWARTVSGSRVARATQAGRGGNWADVRRVRPEWSGRATGVREGTVQRGRREAGPRGVGAGLRAG